MKKEVVLWENVEEIIQRSLALGGTNKDFFLGAETAAKYIKVMLESKKISVEVSE